MSLACTYLALALSYEKLKNKILPKNITYMVYCNTNNVLHAEKKKIVYLFFDSLPYCSKVG